MTRLLLLLFAAALALCAVLAPPSWPIFAGQLHFITPFPPANAVLGQDLPIILISQYQGLATDNVNCGPASVAAIVRYVRPDMATDTAALVAVARSATREPQGDTDLPGLMRALNALGVPSAPFYAGDARGGGGDPLAAVQIALAEGRPVIVTLAGASRGRGSQYGDHFVVIIGMNAQSGVGDVVDPDTQTPRDAAWMPGGKQQWPASLVRTAMQAAQEKDALGVIAGAQRTGVISPLLVFLSPAGILVLLGLLPRRLYSRNKHPL